MRGLGLILSLVVCFSSLFSHEAPCGQEESVVGASSEPSPSMAPVGSTFYCAPLTNNPSTLDPAWVEDMYGVTVVQQLFDGLVKFNASLMVTPALAQSWLVEDGGKRYKFFLHKDARFHNGQTVKAHDVLFSLRRLFRKESPPAILSHLSKIKGADLFLSGAADNISGLSAPDDYTVVVDLQEPYVPFLIALGMFQAKIVPEEEVKKAPEQFGKHPVGSGPFQFTSWEENRRIILERYDDHYGGSALLPGIQFLIYPGSRIEDVLADFKAGKLHEMPVYGSLREVLEKETDLKRVHRPSLSLLFYGFNCAHPLLGNKEIRRALSMAIQRPALVSKVYGGQFEPATGILPPGMPGYTPKPSVLDSDIQSAAQLMKKARGDNGEQPLELEIACNSRSALAQAELEFIQEAWLPLNVKLKPNFILDWTQFQEYLKQDSLQLYRYVWFADIPDPDSFLQPLFMSVSKNNFTRFTDRNIDEMIKLAQTIADPQKRAHLYGTIEASLLRDHPMIPLFYLSIDSVYKSQVRGIEVNALGSHTMSYQKVWLDSGSQ